jgi:hypothetical protein
VSVGGVGCSARVVCFPVPATWALRCVSALWLVCTAARLAAADEAKRVRASLELTAPKECADRSLLVSGITRRSQRIHITTAPEARHVQVRITRAGEALRVVLNFQQPNRRQSSRVLRAASCDEAFEAAALVTALSLDPSASTAPERELPAAPAPTAAGVEPAAAAAEPAPASPAGPPPLRSDHERTPEGPSPDAAARMLWSAGVAFAATWQPAPAAMPGLALSAMVRDESGGAFAPAARLTLSHFGRGGFSASSGIGEASFQLDSATLELCPLRLELGAGRLAPCGFVTGGVLRARGFEALEVRGVTRPWWVFGASALAIWPLSNLLQLEAGAHVGKPTIRDRFQFEPLVVHSVRPWVVTCGLGAGFVFR